MNDTQDDATMAAGADTLPQPHLAALAPARPPEPTPAAPAEEPEPSHAMSAFNAETEPQEPTPPAGHTPEAEAEQAAGTPPEEQEDPGEQRDQPDVTAEEAEHAHAAAFADVGSALDTARREYWRSVLTGSPDTVPDAVRRRAGAEGGSLSDAQSEYRLLSTINRSWAVDHMGVSRERVRASWGRLRAELARRYNVADDEQELFTALSVEAQDAPRRERVQAIYETHYRAALLGQEAATPPLPPGGEDVPYAAELASAAQRKGAALRQRYLPLARELVGGMDVFAGLEDAAIAAPRVLTSLPAFARAVDALAGMEERERQLVYAMAQSEFREQHPQSGASLYRTMLRASRRGASGLGIGAGQALAHAAVATLASAGSSLGGEVGARLQRASSALDLRTRIADEVRHLLHEDVSPLAVSEEAGLVGQLAVDAAGATPAAMAAFCGGAGFATLGLAGIGEAVAAARRRAPEGNQQLQYLAGVIGGGIQAGIYMGMGRIGGQMLSNAIGNFARASGSGARGYTLASLGALGALSGEEARLLLAGKAADAASLGAQELAARLEKTASNIDWRAYGSNALEVETNLREAAMLLPFILIGSGRVALRHFRSRDAVLGDGYALEPWGIEKPTRDAIMNEPDVNRQGELLRDALRGSRRWSAPGFIPEALRALCLLNTDYYQGFKDPQTVQDFLKLPAQSSLVPRAPLIERPADTPEQLQTLMERHGKGEKTNPHRLALALQLTDEWSQKAHLVPESPTWEPGSGEPMPTALRRGFFGRELLAGGSMLPPRLRPGGFYAPGAEAERMAMLRDRVAELHDLSYQVLLSSFTVDALSHSSRSMEHLRRDADSARHSLLEAVGRSVIRRATGTPEYEAMNELGRSITNYFWRRRYASFPPGWMSRVEQCYTRRLDEYARATFAQELRDAPDELRSAYRVALGFRACASALYELLPTTPDFQTALSRGLSPAEAYTHLLSRELGVDVAQARGVPEMLAPFGPRDTDMRAYRIQNETAFEAYSALTGCGLERARGGANGAAHWRVRRPDGSYTRWHRLRRDAINDMVANASFTFMPFSYDRMAPLYHLQPGQRYDLTTEGRAGGWSYTGYDNLCRIALRDAARSWVESAPYAQPGFELTTLRRYPYLGGQNTHLGVLTQESENRSGPALQVDTYTMATPLSLAQTRFRIYWWRQLAAGLLSAEQAGDELVKLRVISPEERQRVLNIAVPPPGPYGPNVPLNYTPPPDTAGMHRAMATHLADFSLRYFLGHLDAMPLPASTREWFKLAPLCPQQPGKLPATPMRISLKENSQWLTSLHNRLAVRELRGLAPAVASLRAAERAGLLINSPLLPGFRSAVGLNRSLNLEQAWCAKHSGTEAMMAASTPYWHLMEHPLEGWLALPEGAQHALRRHVEGICRTELSPEAMEAEGRGETPDYVLLGLQNLQDVLHEHPGLHQYGLAGEQLPGLVRRLTLNAEEAATAAPGEPDYEPAPLYTGGPLQEDTHLGPPAELPETLLGDARVLPALHLLGALRTYPASLPYVRREGITWQGQLYGGPAGRPLPGLESGWSYEPPLWDMIELLRNIDEYRRNLPEGEPLNPLDDDLPGLGEELDLTPLKDVSLYRQHGIPAHLCRLMPGEPDAAHVVARAPYVVQTFAGIAMDSAFTLRSEQDMHRSYVPLENFHPRTPNIQLEKTGEERSKRSIGYALAGALSSTMRRAAQGNPQGGLVSLRELLLRFAEDSGFSLSLRGLHPAELLGGQIRTLRLARELLLCVCGSDPDAAYRRLIRLSHRLRRSPSSRDSLHRTLSSAADSLYLKGTKIFRQPEKRDSEQNPKHPRP